MKRAAVLIFLAIFLLTGCETFSGFGRDMKKAGNWVERKAEQSK
jgi:predicted small secreted protein